MNVLAKSRGEMKISHDEIRLIGRLLAAPLESVLSIFDMPQFALLMNYLDYPSRTTLALRIIESLVNGTSREKLDTGEKVTVLLDFIKPLLADSSDAVESEMYQFEYEQQTVAKLIFVISNTDPIRQLEMINILKNVFLKGGVKRMRFTLPSMINAYLALAYCVSNAYDAKLNNSMITNKAIHDEFISKFVTNFNWK